MTEAKKRKRKVGGQKRGSSRRPSSQRRGAAMPRWKMILISSVIAFTVVFGAYHLFFKGFINMISPCKGIVNFGTCIPKGYNVYGIDISHHQGYIDWEEFRRYNKSKKPISFVYIKATEGSDHKDTRFDENWKEAKRSGLLRGAYHYFSTTSTGLEQANMFIRTVKAGKGDLPPVVDVEETPKNIADFKEELKIFISKIEEHYGVKPVIYSGRKYKEQYLTDKFFDLYPLWIANYYVDTLDIKENWSIWQCTDKGEIPGIDHYVDINVFNGNADKLQELVIK